MNWLGRIWLLSSSGQRCGSLEVVSRKRPKEFLCDGRTRDLVTCVHTQQHYLLHRDGTGMDDDGVACDTEDWSYVKCQIVLPKRTHGTKLEIGVHSWSPFTTRRNLKGRFSMTLNQVKSIVRSHLRHLRSSKIGISIESKCRCSCIRCSDVARESFYPQERKEEDGFVTRPAEVCH